MAFSTDLPRVALVLCPHFSVFHFSIPQMVFSSEVDGQALFELKTVGEQADIPLAGGVSVKVDGDLSLVNEADIVIVPAWNNVEETPSPALSLVLQHAYQRGAKVVGLCYGAYALAYAGLLNGKQAVTHWLGEADFSQRFPQVKLDVNALYVEAENVITSAGTASGLDCCLAIVRGYYGVKIANKLARLFVTSPHREGGQAQFIEQPIPRPTANESINELLQSLRENLQNNYQIDPLAERLSMSRSTFTRHFRKATGMAFNQWLIEARLQKGRDLLESTPLGIETIAQQIGFHSAVSFRQHFREKHQISPSQWRKRFA